ncbi:hypothetical protein UA24_20145, partial [Marinomonas sp. BSi20414]|nr:hypothetical protein [Marinomonas sp. BSi20414]
LDDAYKALPDGKVVHQIDDSVIKIQPRIIKATNAQKGIFGEIISDNLMINKGFENLLPTDRQLRKMTDTPRGRGLDGIYKKPEGSGPPPYVVTETKYKTDSGKFIDSDGVAKSSALSTTKGSPGLPGAKQMSDDWIEPRLETALDNDSLSRRIVRSGYDRWLMIVDSSGEVVNITELDEAAKSIRKVIL